jgi:Trk-type K+ transport system membrane component
MMYISVYPVVITMRNSNVYEERSLGIYDDDPVLKQQEQQPTGILGNSEEPGQGNALRRRKTSALIGKNIRRATTFQGVGAARNTKAEEEPSSMSFIGQQIRGQLAHDLWWLVLAILIIVVIETDHFLGDPITYSVFNILFESVSAYACVGLSIGLPSDSFSFSGGLHTGSKLVLVAVMLRGRHRGLPVALDRAVRLPGDKLIKEEEQDAKIRRTQTIYRMTSRDN